MFSLTRLVLASTLLSACVATTETTVEPESPLSALPGHLHLKQDGTQLQLLIETGGCDRISVGVRGELDGVAGTFDAGGVTTETCDGYGDCYTDCTIPSFTWTNPTFASAQPTFVVADHDTTWTYRIDQPTVARTFTFEAPADGTLNGGDAVAVHLMPASGAYTNATVRAYTTTTLFSVDEGSGLWPNGADLVFTMPAVAETVEAKLGVGATVELPALACDAPEGCSAPTQVHAVFPVSLAP